MKSRSNLALALRRHRALAKRFILTVLLGGILHGVGCIIKPPFEFGKDRPTEFFWATLSGFIFTAVFIIVLFLPVRAALRRFMPQRAPRIHAIMTAAVLWAAVTALGIWQVLSHHTFLRGNYWSWWAFWSIYVFVCVLTLFWPRAGWQDAEESGA